MNVIIRYLMVVIGSLLIALSFNLFVIPNNLLTFGFDGWSAFLHYSNGSNPAINLATYHAIVILIALLIKDKELVSYYLLPAILIPVFIFATSFITVNIKLPEELLTVLVAGTLTGYGYSLIYKQGFSAGALFLLEEIIGKITKFHSKIYSWIFDLALITIVWVLSGYEIAIYSFLTILIAKSMVTKARFGINDSKMFYIITSKERKIRSFIINDLKYELTILDVKGGYSKKANKILLTVISTSDYYKLKEGIKIIDPNAFIAITDTYDVVNRHTF